MKYPFFIRSLPAIAVLAVVASCRDSTGPEQRQSSELHFLRFAANAPAILDVQASFWAKRGEDRELRMRYEPLPGTSESEEFLRFSVPAEALAARPDGTSIAVGDSVLITVTVVNLQELIFDFQPSGLRFNASKPARLKIQYSHADEDLDGDGDVDAEDATLETRIALWKRETSTAPWTRLSDLLHVETDEVEADIRGFTGYALAF